MHQQVLGEFDRGSATSSILNFQPTLDEDPLMMMMMMMMMMIADDDADPFEIAHIQSFGNP